MSEFIFKYLFFNKQIISFDNNFLKLKIFCLINKVYILLRFFKLNYKKNTQNAQFMIQLKF